MKRKIIFEGGVLPDLYSNMADNKDLDKKKCHSDENITSDGASKVIAVELNKRLPKAKENEQDPIPSDGKLIFFFFLTLREFLCIALISFEISNSLYFILAVSKYMHVNLNYNQILISCIIRIPKLQIR